MSVSYTSILWNKNKVRYDVGILIFVLSFLALFVVLHAFWHPNVTMETIIIRGFGWLSLFLLHVILVIGPLSRLNPKFLVILYNRRHLGVTMFVMGAIHGVFSILNFHSLSDMNPIRSVFLSNLRYDSLIHFPFQVLGFFALVILALMACSSHDFWLKNLGPRVWKSLHMLVYVAYGLLVMHVLLGGFQNEASPILFILLAAGFITVSTLHLVSGLKEYRKDQQGFDPVLEWVSIGAITEIAEGQAKVVKVGDNRVAVFRYDGKLSAVSNYCRHQGGPLGEGRIIDGCITCPWHGYQYLPGNGQSPPPFTEKIETYYLRLSNGNIEINPVPNPPGTPVDPVEV